MAAEAHYDLASSTALITGAAGDIGRAAALRLAAAGARLALTDLETAAERLEETHSRCAEVVGKDRVAIATCDVTDAARFETVLAGFTERVGIVDLVFNNAGYQGAFAPTPDYPIDDLRKVLEVNVVGVAVVLQATAAAMRVAGSPGAIVNSASMAFAGPPNMLGYGASKGAVVTLTRTAALDLAPLGIRVNAVSPAFIGPGAMWDRQVELQAAVGSQYYSTEPAMVARQMIEQVPLRRHGTLEEVASVVVWLLSHESSYLTGENIHVSGGI